MEMWSRQADSLQHSSLEHSLRLLHCDSEHVAESGNEGLQPESQLVTEQAPSQQVWKSLCKPVVGGGGISVVDTFSLVKSATLGTVGRENLLASAVESMLGGGCGW